MVLTRPSGQRSERDQNVSIWTLLNHWTGSWAGPIQMYSEWAASVLPLSVRYPRPCGPHPVRSYVHLWASSGRVFCSSAGLFNPRGVFGQSAPPGISGVPSISYRCLIWRADHRGRSGGSSYGRAGRPRALEASGLSSGLATRSGAGPSEVRRPCGGVSCAVHPARLQTPRKRNEPLAIPIPIFLVG